MRKSNLWKVLLLVVCAGYLLTACSDDDNNPFTGVDNSILSFSLSKGEQTWQASVVDNEIVITVPEGTDLNEATASYRLSEQASITPDPAGIKQWNEEQRFTVTSYNQSSRTYTYKIQHSAVNETGNFTLNSQAEVDALGKRDVTVIEGSLIIGTTLNEADPITNLNSLSKLTEIVDDLQIGIYYQGEDLSGLDKIKKLGSFVVANGGDSYNSESLVNVSLPSLTHIRKDLNITNGKNFQTVSFPLLETILGSSTIKAESMTKLNLNSLQKVGGDFSFENNQLSSMEFPALTTVGGKISISISSSTGFPNLSIVKLPALTSCTSLYMKGGAKLETLQIPVLKNIPGVLSIANCPVFSDINKIIKDIESIGTLSLSSTNVLQLDIKGKKVSKISLAPSDGDQFTLTGDEAIGDLEFSSMTQTPLPIFAGISTLNSYAIKTARSSIEITGIKHITGKLSTSSTRMESLKTLNLPDLESVGSINTHMGNRSIADSFDADKLTTITGDITISVYKDQQDMSYIKMTKLKVVEGTLNISGATISSPATVTKIDCFPSLQSVKAIKIQDFKNLSDFSDFWEVAKEITVDSNWSVIRCKKTPTLTQMHDSPNGDFTNN